MLISYRKQQLVLLKCMTPTLVVCQYIDVVDQNTGPHSLWGLDSFGLRPGRQSFIHSLVNRSTVVRNVSTSDFDQSKREVPPGFRQSCRYIYIYYKLWQYLKGNGVRKKMQLYSYYFGSPGTEVTDRCEFPRGSWEQNPDSLQDQPSILNP